MAEKEKEQKNSKEEKEKKVLVIGSEGHFGVKCLKWSSKELPNIADYDAVIINVTTLREEYENFEDKRLVNIKYGLLRLLDSDGKVFAICPRNVSLSYGENNYSWSPIPLNTFYMPGDTIRDVAEKFQNYFGYVKRWDFWFIAKYNQEELEHIKNWYEFECNIKLYLDPIAKNRADEAIACIMKYSVHKVIPPSIPSYSGATSPKYEEEPYKESGHMYFLPVPTEIRPREAINLILADFFGREKKALPPEWVDKINIPGEEELRSRIETEKEAMSEIENRVKELEDELNDIARFKGLLYETGEPLEELVKFTLEKLGARIGPPEFEGHEEYLLIRDEGRAVVEVKGNTKSISKGDMRAVLDYIQEYELEKDEKVKGILIGNAWRLNPLEERGTQKKQVFPDNVKRSAKSRDIALVSTIELFNAYCAFLKGEIGGKEVVDKIFHGNGEVKILPEQNLGKNNT